MGWPNFWANYTHSARDFFAYRLLKVIVWVLNWERSESSDLPCNIPIFVWPNFILKNFCQWWNEKKILRLRLLKKFPQKKLSAPSDFWNKSWLFVTSMLFDIKDGAFCDKPIAEWSKWLKRAWNRSSRVLIGSKFFHKNCGSIKAHWQTKKWKCWLNRVNTAADTLILCKHNFGCLTLVAKFCR